MKPDSKKLLLQRIEAIARTKYFEASRAHADVVEEAKLTAIAEGNFKISKRKTGNMYGWYTRIIFPKSVEISNKEEQRIHDRITAEKKALQAQIMLGDNPDVVALLREFEKTTF